ncbi:hypothetical protein HYALB_00001289 [Hymenoscyphus albidus]|uniref:SGT1-domain-containing protein n=1 Tax=Hymenoscyphus albidus TaxID=595503 RepID=A0A9N9Q2L5_9HELO|nr:hypothetical protein HYALB_00001289 [Hymenoscyphus albidus]
MNAPSKDDLPLFGDNFDGFPKRLPDDCVEYALFVVDAKLKSPKELVSRLEVIRKEALKLAGGLLQEYIWQRDGFTLELDKEKGMHLRGMTNFGDSVDDEWLIVYILKELSKRFQDLWIKIVDTDGEFLLIEAANALPRWLNPEIADNRVWIHNNSLRIIPRSAATSTTSATAQISRSLTLEEAHETISKTPAVLINSPLIEAEAFYRLRNYPAQIATSLHYAVVVLPGKLAYVLHDRPASIAPATEAFYLRDPIALKPLQTTSTKLTFIPEDLITVSVRFTRVLYAQLKSQQFSAPLAWKDLLLKAEKEAISCDTKRKEYTRLEMGMKVTSGFEMLLNDPKNGDNRAVREIRILLDDLEAGDEILPTDEVIAKWRDITREDDERWLDINFEDFERELDGKSKEKKAGAARMFGPESSGGVGDARTQTDLKKMVDRFESFLNDDEAGVDGAEVDDMDIDDDDDSDENSDEDSDEEDKEMSFDENEFSRMMREMMGLPAEEDMTTGKGKSTAAPKPNKKNRVKELLSDEETDDENEIAEIQKLMKSMEVELNEAGALNLDPAPGKNPAIGSKGTSKKTTKDTDESGEESDDDDVNIDFNLAENLLESLKSQAGMPGPGGNLMGMMGMQLPRDEEEPMTGRKS